MAQPRILTFNFHEPYLCLMAKTGLAFDVGEYREGAMARPWQYACRAKPEKLTLLEEDVWRDRLQTGGYDVLIAHNEMNAANVCKAPCAKLLVCHNRRSFINTSATADEGDPIEAYTKLLAMLQQFYEFIFISETKRDDYGIQGRVILPGVDPEFSGGYSGENARVLRVGNVMRERNLMFDVDFQEAACGGLTNRVLGLNPAIPNAGPAASHDALLEGYRRDRCLLHVTRAEYEDGYNLAMLEAMACGMPVVSLDNPTSPLTGGVDGYVSYSAGTLHQRLEDLIADRGLACEIGERGRLTALEKFPLERFVENWRAAILDAVEKHTPAARRPPITPAKRLNLLLHHVSSPITTARYFEQAARAKYNVLTAGFRIKEDVLRHWGFQDPVPPYSRHCIEMDLDAPFKPMLDALPRGYQPDLLLWIDSGQKSIAPDLVELPMPKAAYLIDTHIAPDSYLAIASQFDCVFLAQKGQVELYRRAGIENVSWLPLACSTDLHNLDERPRIYDAAYVGSLSKDEGPRRFKLIAAVGNRFPNSKIGRFWPHEMAQIYAGSKIVVNTCVNRDVNMRVFEAMASGALLITDEAVGLEDLFEDGKHLVIYRRDEDLLDLVARYLEDDAARERIARAGQDLVLTKHNYAHRVDAIVEKMKELGSMAAPRDRREPKYDSYYMHARRELLPHIPISAQRVLDVGCGAGGFGTLLKAECGVPEVVGIEFVEEAAKEAEKVLDRVITGNIEELDLPFEEDYFDCIVCADVLEHLVDPAAALKKLARVLAPHGVVVISIPNIRYHEAVRMLASGAWTYMPEGIMDNTHLRFFTRTGIKNMIEAAGLEAPVITPLSEMTGNPCPRKPDGSLTLGKLTIRGLDDEEYREFLVYQYLALACKPGVDRLERARKALEADMNEAAHVLASEAIGVDEFLRKHIIAKALAKNGQLENAETSYREALDIRDEPAATGELGILLIGMKRLNEAKPYLERALSKDGSLHRTRGALGLALLCEQRFDEAFGHLMTALNADFTNHALLHHYIEVSRTLQRLEEAEPIVRRFTDFYPGNFDYACEHARMLIELGQGAEAKERLESLLLLAPGHEAAASLLGEINP